MQINCKFSNWYTPSILGFLCDFGVEGYHMFSLKRQWISSGRWKIFFFQLLLKYAGQQNMNLMIATKLFQQDSHYWFNPLLAAWFWRAGRLPVEAKMWECFGAAGFCQAYHSAQKIKELTFIRSILWVHAQSGITHL